MALGGDFLARIKLALEGKQKVVSGLAETQRAAQQLSKTKIVTQFDKQGLVRGKRLEQTFRTVTDQVKKGAPLMEQFGLAMRRALVVAPIWMIMRGAIQSVVTLIRDQIKFIIDMEEAMARIQIVGKGTVEELENLKFSLIGLSLAYGVSASKALEAAKIFAQQGRTVSETFLLTRAAMIGSRVLGKEVTVVVEDLTAAMKAFGIPAQQAIGIIDQLINVERQFAVTSKELAEGIKRTGATANQMGVTMAALTGDITAVVEVTRRSGQQAARGLQFIYARLLTTAKPVIERLAGISFYLDEQNRATSELTGNLRSATDILDDLAQRWETLSNEERLNIAVATGSKRQLVTLNALMQNYARSIDARIAALTSAGEAERALAIVQDTVTYKTQQLANAWNALTSAVADTSVWKETLDLLSYAISSYAKLISFEKGYRIELAKQSEEVLTNIEIQQSQISNIEELVKIRDKLIAKPPTDRTTERLERINNAINQIVKEQPTLKIALESGNINDLRKSVDDISDFLLRQKIVTQVGITFIPQLAELDKRKKELEDALRTTILPQSALDVEERILDLEKAREHILKKQSAEIQKQLTLARAENIVDRLDDEEEELNLTGELTDKEEERLEIERELLTVKLSGVHTTEEQIKREIELVKNSKAVYDIHEKNLRLAKLENQLVSARAQDTSKLVKHELDLATLRGASGKQLFDLEVALKGMIIGEEAVRNSLWYQLELEKQITEEKYNQTKIQGDIVKMHELANKGYLQEILQINEVLAGRKQINEISQKALEIFKAQFPREFRRETAEQYFENIFRSRGITPYRYGQEIPVRGQFRERVTGISIPAITTNVGGISVNITQQITEALRKEKVSEKIIDDLIKSIRENESLKRAIDEKIESF